MATPTDPSPAPARLRRWLGQRLLAWFSSHQRDLPWRADRDPYRIWISEVMLQQTQVATVIPYFERFLQAFPTLTDLASASEQDVLRLWEGLGYYRRARDLHRAARHLHATHGTFPSDSASLHGVPGLGRYTRNAVLSQAFDLRLPILEANSLRVLCRLFGRTEDPSRGPLRRWLWQAAEDILPRERAGEFNQALMELGALVCTPAAPKCAECPLRGKCAARRLGLQAAIPLRSAPQQVEEVREVAVVLRRGTRVLLAQRPANAKRWANLWEFPHGELKQDESHESAAPRLLLGLTGMSGRIGSELLTIRHGVTRYRITMVCFEARHEAGTFNSDFYQQAKWIEPRDLSAYPVSSPQRRLARALVESGRQRQLF